jgi:hypothetical protein
MPTAFIVHVNTLLQGQHTTTVLGGDGTTAYQGRRGTNGIDCKHVFTQKAAHANCNSCSTC